MTTIKRGRRYQVTSYKILGYWLVLDMYVEPTEIEVGGTLAYPVVGMYASRKVARAEANKRNYALHNV
jgi:hypothetical protein